VTLLLAQGAEIHAVGHQLASEVMDEQHSILRLEHLMGSWLSTLTQDCKDENDQ